MKVSSRKCKLIYCARRQIYDCLRQGGGVEGIEIFENEKFVHYQETVIILGLYMLVKTY